MAWNTQESGGKKEAPKKAKLGRWLATTGLTIAVLAGGAVYFLNHPVTPKADKQEKSRAKIAEAQADLSEAPEVEETPKKPEKPKEKPIPPSVEPDSHGVLRWPSGARYFADYGQEKDVIDPYKGQKRLFKHGSETHIATLLTHQPGNMIIGGFEYGDFFDKDFVASLDEEIEFLDDDTEEERELKEDVIAVKEELKAAMARGEKPSQIMQEAREELVKQFQYKQNLAEQLAIIKNSEDATTQDMIDATKAANLMLEREGLEGFPLKTLLRRRARELGL